LVYFMFIWYIYPALVSCIQKHLATLLEHHFYSIFSRFLNQSDETNGSQRKTKAQKQHLSHCFPPELLIHKKRKEGGPILQKIAVYSANISKLGDPIYLKSYPSLPNE
jgi:hypothetical protein